MRILSEASSKLRICMVVACANDVSGSAIRDATKRSPLLHTAIHNLLEGLRDRDDVAVEVVYGRQTAAIDEDRHEGSIHYIPVRYRPLPVPGMGGPYLARTLALLRYIRQSKPDVVHGQGTERESGLVAALAGFPSVLTLHGNFREISRTLKTPPWDYHSITARIETFAAKRVSGILCISNYTKNLVSDLNSDLWVVPNAVNSDFYKIRNTPTIGKVVCMAAITERKNQIEFLKAFRCSRVRETLSIEFWGPINETHPYAREFLDLIHTTPNATYCGSVSADGVGRILESADILLLPSIEDNCPVCILEAMACGVPVVASAVGGVPDLVIEGETGYLSNPSQQERLVEGLAEIACNRSLREEMSANSRTIATDRYSPSAVADAHIAVYRECLAKSQKSA